MQFPTQSSPHWPSQGRVSRLMLELLLALAPATAVATWAFGVGVLVNIAVATLACLAGEAGMLALRRRPVRATLADGSAAVTGVLLGLCLPPLAPWWIPLLGGLFAIVVAKQLYGGLGYNTFNPAMVGFVVLLISFPFQMTLWPPPVGLGQHILDSGAVLGFIFHGSLPEGLQLDALTGATPLDIAKTELARGFTLSEIYANPLFGGDAAARGWAWVNLAFLAGGLWLIWRRVIAWQIPAAVLLGLGGMAMLFALADPDHFPSPLFHWLGGAAMVGAFFIATDPVSASTTPRGRWIYGLGIGIIVYLIRSFGGYPEGLAFAVLLMNMAVPTIDQYTRPRVFGERSGGTP